MKLQKLMENPYAWAVLSICTIIALIFTIYTWIVGRKRKEIACFYNTLEIVKAGKNIVPKLELLYEGIEIDDLTVTKYAIWNSGNEVLYWSDIVATKSLKVISNEKVKILDAQILVKSDETNLFEIIETKDNYVNMSFDYLDVKDGIVLQILHTGEATDLNVECRIKGGKKFKNLNHRFKKKNEKKDKNIKRYKIILLILMGILILLMSATVGLFVMSQMGIISIETLREILFLDSHFNGMFTMLLYVVAMVIFYIETLKRYLYIGIPAKLKKYISYDDFGYNLKMKGQ